MLTQRWSKAEKFVDELQTAIMNATSLENMRKDILNSIDSVDRRQRRLHVLRRGRETGEGEIELHRNRSNAGYIDFTDDHCVEFNGVINAALLGKDVPFFGYKVGDSAPRRRTSARGSTGGDSWVWLILHGRRHHSER